MQKAIESAFYNLKSKVVSSSLSDLTVPFFGTVEQTLHLAFCVSKKSIEMLKIFGGVDADGRVLNDGDFDRKASFEDLELLEIFGELQRRWKAVCGGE